MGAQRENRELRAGESEDGTAREGQAREKPKREESPKDRREGAERERERERKRQRAEREEGQAVEEQAVERLLEECRRKAQNNELGEGGLVEKNPGLAPGQADDVRQQQGREKSGSSQQEKLETEAAGMDRGELAEGTLARGEADGIHQVGGERRSGSQFFQGGSGRPQMKGSRQEASYSVPRLDLIPCRGEDFEHRRPHPMGQLQNKCHIEEIVVGEMGHLLARMLEVFDQRLNTRCGQTSEGIFPLPLPTQLAGISPGEGFARV